MSTLRQEKRLARRAALIGRSLRGQGPLIERSFDRWIDGSFDREIVGSLVVAGLVAFSISQPAHAQAGTCSSPQAEAYLDVNNVRARLLNNGSLFANGSSATGYEVPKHGGTNAVLTQVVWIGGYVADELRMAAARYGPFEFWSGPIDETTAMPPGNCDDYDRIFVVSRQDVTRFEDGELPASDLLAWPTGLGAPTVDADGREVNVMPQPLPSRADRVIDLDAGERPAFVGDQMAWWVMNDVGNEHGATNTQPLRVEVHVTAFAFDLPGPLAETTFFRYRIMYRGASTVDSLHVGVFHDGELGQYDDDYVGVDTSLGLAYTYNSDNNDGPDLFGRTSYGSRPPAVGVDFVRSPEPEIAESALRMDTRTAVPGTRVMTSLMPYFSAGGNADSPTIGSEYFNYMSARWRDGQPLTIGGVGLSDDHPPIRFAFPGDPVMRSYWSEMNVDGDGDGSQPSDRRFYAASGPYTLQPGEEREFIVAVVWARGQNHLDSVTQLRRADRVAQAVADADFDVSLPQLDAPTLLATPLNGAVVLAWSNPDSSNNAADGFSAYAARVAATYELEGYDVFSFDSSADSVGVRIASYDKVNSVRRVVDGKRAWWPESDTTQFIAAEGRDTGLAHEHVVGGLDNHRTYHFGVQAYAYQDGYYPKVIRSTMARVSIEPRAEFPVIDSSADAIDAAAVLDAMGVVPNPYMAASAYEVNAGDGNGGGSAEVRFVNVPAGSSIRVFTLSGSLIKTLQQVDGSGGSGNATLPMVPPPPVRWDLTNESGRRISGGLYLVHVYVPGLGERVLKFSMVEGR